MKLDLHYYEILGISSSASMEEVEAAYQKAQQIYSQGNPEFKDSFDETEASEIRSWVEEAYQVLAKKLKDQNKYVAQKNAAPVFQFEAEDISKDKIDLDSTIDNDMLKNSFYDGLLLKKIRLKKNISLNYIANKTCIGVHHLIAIEANDFSSLPAAVFVRSYVKQIAQILGLNQKDVSEAYMRLYSETRAE